MAHTPTAHSLRAVEFVAPFTSVASTCTDARPFTASEYAMRVRSTPDLTGRWRRKSTYTHKGDFTNLRLHNFTHTRVHLHRSARLITIRGRSGPLGGCRVATLSLLVGERENLCCHFDPKRPVLSSAAQARTTQKVRNSGVQRCDGLR
jgi:hypothetical protein